MSILLSGRKNVILQTDVLTSQLSMKRQIIFVLLFCICFAKVSANNIDARRDSILSRITGAVIPSYAIDIRTMGAKGDGKTDCHRAFVRAMEKARKKGGARVVIPEGRWLVKGPIHLEDNVCLDIRKGAVLLFSSDPSCYLPTVKTSWEGTYLQNYSPFIYAYGKHDVSIIGEGTIDGNCAVTFGKWRPLQKTSQSLTRSMNHEGVPIEKRNFGEGSWLRPQLIQFFRCKNITVSDVFITNSPFWCVHLLQSENIICRGLRYDAKLVNNDGIDPESSRDILIEDVSFNNGDDNIAIKSGRDNDGWTYGMPCENIIIRRCHFKGLHAVVLGSELSAGIRNVYVEDCDWAGYVKRAFYVKSNPDRGGFVDNLVIRHCKFSEVEDLFYVTSMYAGEGKNSHNYTDIKNIRIEDVSCDSVSGFAIAIQGSPSCHVRDIRFCQLKVKNASAGFSIENADGITLADCFIGGNAGVPTQVSDKDKIFSR